MESDPAFRKLESRTRKVCLIYRLTIKHAFWVQLSNFRKAGKWKAGKLDPKSVLYKYAEAPLLAVCLLERQ